MPLIKSTTAPNGAAVSFHKALRARLDIATDRVEIDVASWSDEASYLAGDNLVWSWPIDAPSAALTGVDTALAATVPFDGATVVTDDALTLDALKLRKWAALKDARDTALEGGFTWDGSKFDSDDRSQQRIQGAVQLAVLAAQAGQAFSIDWTLFDNSTRTLSGAEMIGVGMALGEFVRELFAAGVTVREQVDAAADAGALAALSFPILP